MVPLTSSAQFFMLRTVLIWSFFLEITVGSDVTNGSCIHSLKEAEISFLSRLPHKEILGLAELCSVNSNPEHSVSIIDALKCVKGKALADLRESLVELGFSDEAEVDNDFHSSHIALIDCFPYNGELVAPLRIQTVYPIVDEIVIVEAWQSYSKHKNKDILFFELNKDLFAPFADKIQLLPIHIPEDAKLWAAEKIVRSQPTDYIRRRWRGRRYIVHFSDADEIPTAGALGALRGLYPQLSHEPMYLRMLQFSYHFGWQKMHHITSAFAVADPALDNHTLHYYRWEHPKA
jgi:hypothetical protein